MRRKSTKRIENPIAICIVGFVFIGICFAVGGLTTYFMGIRWALMNHYVKQNWEKVPCKILYLEPEHFETGTTQSRMMMLRVKAEYTYVYQDKQYTSNKYNFFNTQGTFLHNKVVKYLSSIIYQNEPMCFVNPENPEEAVLDSTLTPTSKTAIGLGLLPILFGIFLMFKLYSGYKTGFKLKPRKLRL